MIVALVWTVALLVLGCAARPPGPRVPLSARWGVAAVLALAVALPAVPTCWQPARAVLRVVLELPALPVVCACALVLMLALASVRLPRGIHAYFGGPAPADAVAEVAAVAAAMHVRAPEVLQLRAGGGVAMATAMAWGLLRPVVLLGDGIALRLQAPHRRAIVAHELAHVRSRHVALRLFALALVLTAVVAAVADRPLVALALMLAGSAFVWTLLGQHQELAADAAAAHVAGVRDTAEALGEVHAANMLRVPFAGEALFFAVATHPSLAVRAAALGVADPAARRTAVRHRRTRRVVVPLWGALLVAALLAPPRTLAGSVLPIAAVLPVFLQLLLRVPFARQRRDHRALGLGEPFARVRLAVMFAGMIAVVAWLGAPSRASAWQVWGGLAVVGVAGHWHQLAMAPRARLQRLLAKGELDGFLRAFAALPAWRRRRPDLAIQAAIVRTATGDRAGALAALAALADHRGARFYRAFLLHAADPSAARALLAPLAAELPHNGPVQALLAEVEARCGAFDDARRRIDVELPTHPRDGSYAAVAAGVELRAALAEGAPDRLQPGERAERMLVLAERLSPGDPLVVARRAHFDAATGAPAAAQSLQRLRELAQALPLALLGEQLAEVEAIRAGPAGGAAAAAGGAC